MAAADVFKPARVRPRTEPWPEDIVQHVYTLGLDKGALELKDRLRGLTVCRSWLEALFDLPIRTVYLSQLDVAVCHWIIKFQPSIVELHLCQGLSLVMAVQILHSVQREDLQLLEWNEPNGGFIQGALPVPSIFPNLRNLCVEDPVGSDWVAGLGALEDLQWLELSVKSQEEPAGSAIQLPLLPRLTCLVLDVQPGAVVQLHLGKLPALSELVVDGGEGGAALLTDEPVRHLHHLDCGGLGRLSADFVTLPGLESVVLGGRMELEQPGSIAAATALTWLGLRYNCHGNDPDPVALELLGSLPPSVSCLELKGSWTAQAAALVGGMRGLAGLALSCWGQGEPIVPPLDARLWAGIQAFSWVTDESNGGGGEPSLPQALARASQLGALQVIKNSAVSVYELDLITSLPALEDLILATRANNDTCGAANRRIAQRAMPYVHVVGDCCWQYPYSLRFFKWAFE